MQILEKQILAPFTTFKIGGPARYYCRPENETEVKEALLFAVSKKLSIFVLGGGSNVLFNDNGFEGLIIHTCGLSLLKTKGNIITAGSGVDITKLNTEALTHSLSGLEFTGGLPGTTGGTAYMNARCYGHSFSEIVQTLTAFDFKGNRRVFENKDLKYAYKYSSLQDSPWLITEIAYSLNPGKPEEIKAEMDKNRQDRVNKGQFDYPSAGCFFKNDYSTGIPAGKMIEDLGLKGLKIGAAGVFQKHGNFLINTGDASAEDILKIAETVKQKAKQERGWILEEEVTLVGW